jgi:hypothetical protein
MRVLLLTALAALSFTATMTYEPSDANAIVCARGIFRAACVGRYGGVVVRRPYVGGVYGGAVVRRGVYGGVVVRRPFGRGIYVRRF